MDTLISVIVAVAATLVAQFGLKIRPRGGLLGGFIVSYIFCALGRLVFPRPEWDTLFGSIGIIPRLAWVWIPWYWWAYELAHANKRRVEMWWDGPNNPVNVYPRIVELGPQEEVLWCIDEKDGDTVDIIFDAKLVDKKPVQGPFEKGEFRNNGSGEVSSGKAMHTKHEKGSYWSYTVKWKRGQDTAEVDPGVMTRG